MNFIVTHVRETVAALLRRIGVTNITDAMIPGRLFAQPFERGVDAWLERVGRKG